MIAFALVVAAAAAHADAGAPTFERGRAHVAIVRDHDRFDVHVESTVHASRRVAWDVLTDYDHLAQFVPDMTESRVQYREGDSATVVQRGRVGFLFFTRDFTLTFGVTERPYDWIDTVQVAGSFKTFHARYRLDDAPDGTHVTYAAEFEPLPEFAPPPLIGVAVMRMNIGAQFEAVLREIERRAKADEPARR